MAKSMVKIYIIDNLEKFNNVYTLLKQDASQKCTPDIFVVGLDTEYICKSNYPKEFEKSTKWLINNDTDIATCIIQISSQNICMIILLTKLGPSLPQNLIKILTKDVWVKCGVGIELDLKYLSENYNLGHCAGGFELKTLAQICGFQNANMEKLYSTLTSSYVKKDKSIHDWSSDKLSTNQLEYVASDAIMSLMIFMEMKKPMVDYFNNFNKVRYELEWMNVDDIDIMKDATNWVGKLQEYVQQHSERYMSLPDYTINSLNNNTFRSLCRCGTIHTYGIANSKKDAKQESAKKMLERLGLYETCDNRR